MEKKFTDLIFDNLTDNEYEQLRKMKRKKKNSQYKIIITSDRCDYDDLSELMNYPESIDKILKLELTNLINSVRKKESVFSNGTVEHYCGLYSRLKRKKMKHSKHKK